MVLSYSIQHYSFLCTQLNGPKYCNKTLTIQHQSKKKKKKKKERKKKKKSVQHIIFVKMF